MRRTIVVVSLFATLSCRAAPPLIPQEKPARHVIVFYDISRSVAEDEENAEEKDLTKIIGAVPAGTEVVFIPICANTDGAPSTPWAVEAAPGVGPRGKREDLVKRNEKRAEVLAVMHVSRGTAAATSGYASCVSQSLRRVRTYASSPQEAALTDILFISDMIEECEYSLLGRRTILLDPHIKDALTLVDEKSTLLELPRGLHVYVFKPLAQSTMVPRPHYPSAQQLELFWVKLFGRCGIHEDQLKWDADMDRYLKTLVPK